MPIQMVSDFFDCEEATSEFIDGVLLKLNSPCFDIHDLCNGLTIVMF